MMSGLFVVVLRVRQSLRLHRTSGPRSFVLRQAFAWNPHSLGISPQEAHLEDEMLMGMMLMMICARTLTLGH